MQRALECRPLTPGSCVYIQLHIDGMSLFRGSSHQLWPILCRLLNPTSRIFIVGLYCEMSKPTDVHRYLEDLIRELASLLSDGIIIRGSGVHCRIVLRSVVADNPAKAMLKQVKHHSGLYSCHRCTQRGYCVHRRLIFPSTTGRLRNDIDFRNHRQRSHHTGSSPFEVLTVDMIDLFPNDYMHSVCLGIMRRLIGLWRNSRSGSRPILDFSDS